MPTKLEILLIVFFIILLFISWAEFKPISTPQIKDKDGEIASNSIAELESINIGGMNQWILIRGNDVSNPVLLWLHGGPGAAQIPVSHYFNGDLEKEFIVVNWDQRGAGKSNPRTFDETTMTIQQYVSDVHELTEYLKERFNQAKIYLVGHSWGTLIGIETVKAQPEDYYAYVAVSQLASHNYDSHTISYQWLLEQIENKGDAKDFNKLQELGEPPFTDHEKYVKFANMLTAYGGGMDIGTMELALIAFRSSEYRLSDYYKWLEGANRGSGQMWDSYILWNLFEEVPTVEVPIYFFSGRNDYNTPLKLVKDYYEFIEAPKGKNLVIFEESAHAPFMKEPLKFYNEMAYVKEETYEN